MVIRYSSNRKPIHLPVEARACWGEAVEQEEAGGKRLQPGRARGEPVMREERLPSAQPMTSPLARHSCPGIQTPVSPGLHASLGQKGIRSSQRVWQIRSVPGEGAQSVPGLQRPHKWREEGS